MSARVVGVGWVCIANDAANAVAKRIGWRGFFQRPLPRSAARDRFKDGSPVFPASSEYWRLFDEAERVLWSETSP